MSKVLSLLLLVSVLSCQSPQYQLGDLVTVETTDSIMVRNTRGEQTSPPVVRYWRVNDTLMLECTRPMGTIDIYQKAFGFRTKMERDTLWGQIALRGQRGSYHLVNEDDSYYTLYGATITPQGDVLRVARWLNFQGQVPSNKVLTLYEDDFNFLTWDVEYGTASTYLSEDLEKLPQQLDDEFGFQERVRSDTTPYDGTNGDITYRLLPYWIAQEQAHVARTHHLPSAKRLAAYCELSQDTSAYRMLERPYRPLLAQLLRAYQSYATSPATRRRLDQALHSLAVPPVH